MQPGYIREGSSEEVVPELKLEEGRMGIVSAKSQAFVPPSPLASPEALG